ncbi:T9SS type A sorting domain-containing protein [Seonamhaeicola algicola]|uniref:T9SS type A sorting domain-containing protein n=1 Tax=Seonamhaeicola algicola TaxID=1719036 RepID=A0A5C7AY95_9FLAO|nr:T9SS type A sorting domain-containing protein [Seonamhaeicola algicola]TXE13137.1 T9SS type A sorting domain-containing protein [Seonamhaeicola algicola]
MKQLTTIITLLLALNFSFGQEVFISQYIETSSGSTPKGLEIFNASGVDITFSAANNLQVYLGRNGATCTPLPGTNITTGTLRANEVWIIGTSDLTAYAITNGVNLSGVTDYGFDFNGDDALQLYLGGVLQDTFGTCGIDPGASWSGSGVSTENDNLQVKYGVCSGDLIGWSDPSIRFDAIAVGTNMIGFGDAPIGCCTSSTTWNAGWSNGTPDLSTEVIIASNYDTALYGSFSACSITVSSGDLNIDDGDYVEVQNDVIVDASASIVVQPYGAFIQNNDTGIVTNNGIMQVDKLTAEIDNWYEYTYWSSPVTNVTVGTALSYADSDRIFTYNGALFNDLLAETNNSNVFVTGQDGIDDEGDDWQWVSGTNIMIPGVGYAATHSEAAMLPFPGVNYRYSFNGTFNNGVVTVPVDRNDTSNLDSNWNFIGNPYPSAISVNEFMAQNLYPAGPLDGAVYFWSQNTDYNGTENGNSALNFSISDYAVENGSGGTTGGDGTTTTGFIPSGQGFFVSFSDSAPSNSGNVVFNNAMRRLSFSPDNSAFFKNGNAKNKTVSVDNKFWINLTSDNGVFNQILVAYVSGATNNDDGAFYDAKKIIAPNTYAALYSQIENSNKTFVIQGKAPNSLNEQEQIALGFKTSIDVATLYTLSLAKIQGDFLTNNPVYLKDNLLGKTHNLSESDYTFTSETGTFNERFQIVFSNAALRTNTALANNNSLKITALQDDFVQFSTSNNITIKTVKIYDVLGRTLYNFNGNSSTETYNVSKLQNSVFVAKVTLSNGVEISRKAVKR